MHSWIVSPLATLSAANRVLVETVRKESKAMGMHSAAKEISAEAFQKLPGEPGYRLELVRGMIVRSPDPGLRHGQSK